MSGPHAEQDRTPPTCNRKPRRVCGDDCPVHGQDVSAAFSDAFMALLAETEALEAKLRRVRAALERCTGPHSSDEKRVCDALEELDK